MLYLNDPYLREWDAKVQDVGKEKYIVLDKTAFYPQGGGQPHDTGVMVSGGKEYTVVFVGKFSGQISHEVDTPGLKAGDKVSCKLDWDRRYRLMRMHTAAHLISQALHVETGAFITGNQLGLEKSRIDYSLEDYDPEKLNEYEKKVNGVIEKNLEITFKNVSREDALKDPTLFKLAKGFPEEIREIRIVSIGDYDIQADGGCHVKTTREVGKIRFLKPR